MERGRGTADLPISSAPACGVFLLAAWKALAWLAMTGQIEPAIAATAVIAPDHARRTLRGRHPAAPAMFHTALYLNPVL
ncbi:hypothetical protein OG389_04930 [Streptomyces sp. NBC_00435]